MEFYDQIEKQSVSLDTIRTADIPAKIPDSVNSRTSESGTIYAYILRDVVRGTFVALRPLEPDKLASVGECISGSTKEDGAPLVHVAFPLDVPEIEPLFPTLETIHSQKDTEHTEIYSQDLEYCTKKSSSASATDQAQSSTSQELSEFYEDSQTGILSVEPLLTDLEYVVLEESTDCDIEELVQELPAILPSPLPSLQVQDSAGSVNKDEALNNGNEIEFVSGSSSSAVTIDKEAFNFDELVQQLPALHASSPSIDVEQDVGINFDAIGTLCDVDENALATSTAGTSVDTETFHFAALQQITNSEDINDTNGTYGVIDEIIVPIGTEESPGNGIASFMNSLQEHERDGTNSNERNYASVGNAMTFTSPEVNEAALQNFGTFYLIPEISATSGIEASTYFVTSEDEAEEVTADSHDEAPTYDNLPAETLEAYTDQTIVNVGLTHPISIPDITVTAATEEIPSNDTIVFFTSMLDSADVDVNKVNEVFGSSEAFETVGTEPEVFDNNGTYFSLAFHEASGEEIRDEFEIASNETGSIISPLAEIAPVNANDSLPVPTVNTGKGLNRGDKESDIASAAEVTATISSKKATRRRRRNAKKAKNVLLESTQRPAKETFTVTSDDRKMFMGVQILDSTKGGARCSVCGEDFSRNWTCMRHIKLVHAVKKKKQPRSSKPESKKVEPKKRQLQRVRLLTKKPGQKMYLGVEILRNSAGKFVCGACGFVLARGGSCLRHIRNRHTETDNIRRKNYGRKKKRKPKPGPIEKAQDGRKMFMGVEIIYTGGNDKAEAGATCGQCGMVYSRRWSCMRHIKLAHIYNISQSGLQKLPRAGLEANISQSTADLDKLPEIDLGDFEMNLADEINVNDNYEDLQGQDQEIQCQEEGWEVPNNLASADTFDFQVWSCASEIADFATADFTRNILGPYTGKTFNKAS